MNASKLSTIELEALSDYMLRFNSGKGKWFTDHAEASYFSYTYQQNDPIKEECRFNYLLKNGKVVSADCREEDWESPLPEGYEVKHCNAEVYYADNTTYDHCYEQVSNG